MTRTLSIEETIQRPAPQVWAALTDASRRHVDADGMSADGETAAGTTLTFRAVARIAHISVAASVVAVPSKAG